MANIGTTFTKSGKKAVLCGSGELGKEVALELQRYGVEVVALDKYENAPAMHVAHRSHDCWRRLFINLYAERQRQQISECIYE